MQRLLPLIFLASACTDAMSPPRVAEIPANDDYDPPDCPKDECGMNTGSMGEVYWHDLHLGGVVENGSGVKFKGLKFKPGATLKVDGLNRLIVVDKLTGVPTGDNIVGIEIELEMNGKPYWVKVMQKHHTAKYWAYNPAGGVRIETYTLYWKDDPTQSVYTKKFCTEEATEFDDVIKTDIVAFTGELYEPSTKTITPVADPQWVNFACLGSAPAKMFFSRHTTASEDPAHLTSLDDRRALLNAWTGNYCGDGRSFTNTGEPLRFRDDAGFFPTSSPWSWSIELNQVGDKTRRISSYDAVWGPEGATCIDTPRLRYSTISGNDPGIRDTILDWCGLVGKPAPGPCTETKGEVLTQADWDTADTHILTANPYGDGFNFVIVP